MRVAIVSALSLFALLTAQTQTPATARDYYKELYKAGGLDRVADTYACFFDDQTSGTFFIFGKGDSLTQYLIDAGQFGRLSKEQKALLKSDFLIFRGYVKGVPHSDRDFLFKDGDSWIGEERVVDKDTTVRIRFTVNWQTLRFKRSAELLKLDSHRRDEVPNFGRCEAIPGGVRQHGPESDEFRVPDTRKPSSPH